MAVKVAAGDVVVSGGLKATPLMSVRQRGGTATTVERGHVSIACPNKGEDQDKTDKTDKADKASGLALAAILKKMDDKLDKLDQRMTKMETTLKEGSVVNGVNNLRRHHGPK